MQQADVVKLMMPAHCQEVRAFISNNSGESFGAFAAVNELNKLQNNNLPCHAVYVQHP